MPELLDWTVQTEGRRAEGVGSRVQGREYLPATEIFGDSVGTIRKEQ